MGGESPNFTSFSEKCWPANGKQVTPEVIPSHHQEESTFLGEKLLEPMPSPSS